MAQNPNLTELDSNVALKRTVNALNDTLRTEITNTELSIELSAADGDSVLSLADRAEFNTNISNASSGVVIAEQDSTNFRVCQLYTKNNVALVGGATVDIEVSPVDSGDVWFVLQNVDPAVSGVAALQDITARRIRVSLNGTITDGNSDIYLVVRT